MAFRRDFAGFLSIDDSVAKVPVLIDGYLKRDLPAYWTIGNVKAHLTKVYRVPMFILQLLFYGRVAQEHEKLADIGTPIRLQPVFMTFEETPSSELLDHVLQRDIDGIERLLRACASPNFSRTQDGRTCLHLATQLGKRDSSEEQFATEAVTLLCQAGANSNEPFLDGTPPLCWAAQAGSLEVVRALCFWGADKNIQMDDGRTPAYIAAQKESSDIIYYLGEVKADLDRPKLGSLTPLCMAAQTGSKELVECLCSALAQIDFPGPSAATPLILATQRGHYEIVKFLCTARANIDKERQRGDTPLCLAAQLGDGNSEFIVQALCEARADVNKKGGNQKAPLFIAAREGHLKIVNILCESRADKEIVAECGRRPLHIASSCGHSEIVSALCHARAAVNSGAGDGSTPLFLAGQADHLSVVKNLFVARGLVDQPREDGCTLAYAAAGRDNLGLLEVLVECGTDLTRCSPWSPLFAAVENGHLNIVQYLHSVHANVHLTLPDGSTLLTAAACTGNLEIGRYLTSLGLPEFNPPPLTVPSLRRSLGAADDSGYPPVSRRVSSTSMGRRNIERLDSAVEHHIRAMAEINATRKSPPHVGWHS